MKSPYYKGDFIYLTLGKEVSSEIPSAPTTSEVVVVAKHSINNQPPRLIIYWVE